MPTVFLSSTSRDLVKCREAAYGAIVGLHGYRCVRMEDFGAVDEAADDFCRRKVGECDLVIYMAGPLYGSRTPKGASYTEREFDAAMDRKKPCLVFLTVEDFPIPANLFQSERDRKSQRAFRQKLSKGRIVTRFATSDEIAIKVVQSIRNWEAPTQASLLTSQIKPLSYRVSVLNRSARVSDDEARAAVSALQTLVRRDFVPVWGIGAELTFVAKGSDPEPGSWWLVIEDEPDIPEMISYRTLTSEGLPQAKISVISAAENGEDWTLPASHDLLEMLANPQLNLTVFHSEDGQTGRLYNREICDPVAGLQTSYKIDGVVVSDFVYPAWFESFRDANSTKFDHGGHLSAPFTRAPGGYTRYLDVRPGSGWQIKWQKAAKKSSAKKPPSKSVPAKKRQLRELVMERLSPSSPSTKIQ